MKKITKTALILMICLLCVGCKNDEIENNSNDDMNITQNNVENNFQEELDKKESDYIEGITEPVRIEETEDELRVNVKGNITSIYKCSGDVVTEWYEKYYFDTEEAAQNFAAEQEDKSSISVKNNVVLVSVEIPEGTVMYKSDLVKTYSGLREVYENEQ